MSTTGGAIDNLMTSSTGAAMACDHAIAVSPSSVFYYGADGSVWSVPRVGGDATMVGAATPGGCASAPIIVDRDNLYWVDAYESSPLTTIFSRPLAGGAATTLAASDVWFVDSMVVANGHLYWAVDSFTLGAAQADVANALGVWGVPVGGGTPMRLVANDGGSSSLATDGALLYYETSDGLHSVGFDGSNDHVLSSLRNEKSFVFEGSRVFSIGRLGATPTSDAYSIDIQPVAGGDPRPLLIDHAELAGMAQDNEALYYLHEDYGQTLLMRLRKPIN
ncbi:MAG TPA: hypothetical protein VFF06_21585 [Polyangia bacterium]|nr:hypothetical protein [Polyangia bacterium]